MTHLCTRRNSVQLIPHFLKLYMLQLRLYKASISGNKKNQTRDVPFTVVFLFADFLESKGALSDYGLWTQKLNKQAGNRLRLVGSQ